MPLPVAAAWDRASPRERSLAGWGFALLALALLHALAWQPLMQDLQRSREALLRERATLQRLQARVQPERDAATAAMPMTSVRPAVERVLDAHGLRSANVQLDVHGDRVSLLLSGVRFDALVELVDELSRTAGIRVLEARLIARVQPGTVRAELTFGR